MLVGRRLLTATAFAAVACGAAGCGSEDERTQVGALTWSRTPILVHPPGLPSDRILIGTVRNEGFRKLSLVARDVRVRDAGGRVVDAAVTFTQSFVHGIYPPTREPGQLTDFELERVGRLARLAPGAAVPILVSWRLHKGASPPVRIDYGAGSLPIPKRVRVADERTRLPVSPPAQ
jgi:hypothetical protein